MPTRTRLLLALVVAISLAACKGAPRDAGPEDRGPDLRARVEADLARRGGRRYYIALSDHLMANHPDTVRSCLVPLHGERAAAFDLFMTVDADGSLSDVSAIPATVVGVCMSQKLLHSGFPRPPFSPFHASMPMRFAD